MHGGNQSLAKGQTEPPSLHLGVLCSQAIKRHEEPRDLFLGNPRASVADLDPNVFVTTDFPQNRDRPARRRVLYRICEEIEQDLSEPFLIG